MRSDRLVWTGARGGEAYAHDPLPVSLGAETCVFRPAAIAALKRARRAAIVYVVAALFAFCGAGFLVGHIA